jgi:hypothetical protein
MSYVVSTLHYNEFTLGPTTHATVIPIKLTNVYTLLSKKLLHNIGHLVSHLIRHKKLITIGIFKYTHNRLPY